MNADGSGKRTLYREPGSSAFDPNWSPDGGLILFSIGHYFRAPGIPPSQIATIKPDGTGFTPIVDDGVNNGFPTGRPTASTSSTSVASIWCAALLPTATSSS